ncbi:DedA family protein [Candidatus Pacearchaeota archaeon]|nr:DedA family protein [Candidatus Pacearchaeota archaeon]
MFEFISYLIQLLLLIIEKISYLGILIGMTIESSFFPFPSEIILIPAGILVAQGQMNFFLVLVMAILGSLVGATFNYLFAFYIGRKPIENLIKRYGRFLFLSKKSLNKADTYFQKHGEITTFVARLIPGIRQLISLPAGFAKMNFNKFLLFTFLGSGIWSLFLIISGYFIGINSEFFIYYFSKLSVIISILGVVLFILYFILIKNKRTRN